MSLLKSRDRHSGGRKLTRRTGGAVIVLINAMLDKLKPSTLRQVAAEIEYLETSVWAAYHGKRKLPLQPTLRLCKFLEIDLADAIEAYESQKTGEIPEFITEMEEARAADMCEQLEIQKNTVDKKGGKKR